MTLFPPPTKEVLDNNLRRLHGLYELKGGEYIKDGKLYGWTGAKCGPCKGKGVAWSNTLGEGSCKACGGTGDEHGLMPTQPTNLGEDTE